ncbi:DMT family transporter [bacterium]|nr:DMT family transporter [bacterium]
MNIVLGNIYLLGACVVWATALSLFKRAGKGVDAMGLNTVKNSVGLLFALAWVFVSGGWNAGDSFPAIGAMALAGAIGMGLGDSLFLRAVQTIGVGAATVGILSTPLFALLFEATFLGYRPLPIHLFGIALVLLGVRLALGGKDPIKASQERGIDPKSGAMLVLGAAVLMAAGQVMVRWSFDISPEWSLATSTAVRVGAGVVGLFLFSGPRKSFSRAMAPGPHRPLILWGGLLGTGIGMALYQAGARLTRATMVGAIGATVPLFAIPIAFWIASEKPKKGILAGALVAITGTALLFLPS